MIDDVFNNGNIVDVHSLSVRILSRNMLRRNRYELRVSNHIYVLNISWHEPWQFSLYERGDGSAFVDYAKISGHVWVDLIVDKGLVGNSGAVYAPSLYWVQRVWPSAPVPVSTSHSSSPSVWSYIVIWTSSSRTIELTMALHKEKLQIGVHWYEAILRNNISISPKNMSVFVASPSQYLPISHIVSKTNYQCHASWSEWYCG
jgi:hypothetical protein